MAKKIQFLLKMFLFIIHSVEAEDFHSRKAKFYERILCLFRQAQCLEKLSSDPRALAFFFPSLQSYSLLLRSYPVKPQGKGTGTHKLYCRAPHLQSKLPKQYLKDL